MGVLEVIVVTRVVVIEARASFAVRALDFLPTTHAEIAAAVAIDVARVVASVAVIARLPRLALRLNWLRFAHISSFVRHGGG